jgi:hypothetical protein
VAQISSRPSNTNTANSSAAAQDGRCSQVWSYRFSSSCAWISLPGIGSPSGVL